MRLFHATSNMSTRSSVLMAIALLASGVVILGGWVAGATVIPQDVNRQGDGQQGNGRQGGGNQDDQKQDDKQDGDKQDDGQLPKNQGPQVGPGARDTDGHRIFEREAYDELRTRNRERAEPDITKIVPFRYPENKTPDNMRPTDTIFVRLMGDEKEYEVRWSDVVEIRPFNQLILDEANFLVDAGRFNDAFDYFDFLQKTNADLVARDRDEIPGLQEAINGYLFQEAQTLNSQGERENSLSLLLELYRRDPNYAGLGDELGSVIDAKVTAEIQDQDYAAAQRLLTNLSERFPDNPTVDKWRQQLTAEAQSRFEAAKALFSGGNLHKARDTALASTRIWPLDDTRAFLEEIQQASPRVVVAVELPAPDNPDPNALNDWSSRRAGRLLSRTAAEYIGPGPQGGEYLFPLGDVELDPLDKQMVLRVHPGMKWYPSGREVTGYDLAEQFRVMALPESPRYVPGWNSLLGSLELRNVYEVDVHLATDHVDPRAFLTDRLQPWDAQDNSPPFTNGPFLSPERIGSEAHYRAAEDYFAQGERQPTEIVEQHFLNWQNASAALIDREVAVLDRVAPWDVKRLSGIPYLRVQPYAIPTVHCLIPNLNRSLPSDRTFRRGLLLGLNRQVLLDTLLQGNPAPGSRVISGPFPAGRDVSDVLAYAYDESIQPEEYDPQMGMILCAAARQLVSKRLEERGAQPLPAIPTIVLALPPHDAARVACRTIKQQWERMGLSVQLREQAASDRSDDYDFRFTELQMCEPLVDARRLLGPGGIAEAHNAYVNLALRQLDQATDWRSAADQLKEIHRLVNQDVTILPLWQLTEYFAYHGSLRGVQNRETNAPPVSLYQYLENWQSPPALLPASL